MFTIIDGSFDVSNIFLDCASGTFLDMNSPTVFSGFKYSNVLINDCVKLGTIQNVQSVDAADNGCLQMNDGWTFNIPGGLGVLSIRQFNFGQMANGATAIDIGSSLLRTVELRDCTFEAQVAAAVTGVSGLANSANIAAGNFASVASCEFGPGVTPLVGLTTDDVRWNFNDNVGLQNTSQRALNNINNNATPTVIAATGVAVPVAGTWTLVNNSQFIQGAANTSQIQYIGERPLQFALDVSNTLLAVAASPLCRVSAYINGSPVAGADIVIETSDITNQTGSITWLGQLVQNDIVELFLTNEDNTNDIIYTDGTLRLVALS